MANTREQIIETTCDLMENQGYHATGLNEIIKESGAPKGSLYYYFPQGKEEIASEAIEWAGKKTAQRVREALAQVEDPAEAVQNLLNTIAHFIEVSEYKTGGPITAVAMETATNNERLNLACREAYNEIQAAFREKLLASGFEAEKAQRLALFITAAVEGGVILCRTFHAGDPLRQVAERLKQMVAEEQRRQP